MQASFPAEPKARPARIASRHPILAIFTGTVLAVIATLWVHAQMPAAGAPDAAAGSTDGKTIYEARCADCHGLAGKGDGPASSLLRVRPRDFTSGRFKLRSTESGALPTDADLYKAIKSGMHGSSMPDWGPFLTDTQIQAVTSHIKSFAPRFAKETPQPIAVGESPVASPEIVARGKDIYERLKCAACHGTDGEGRGAISTDLKDDWGYPTAATTLTEPWTFRGGATAGDVFLRFRAGMNGTPMPSFKEAATDAELWQLAHYVVSLARKPVWDMTAAETPSFYAALDEREKADKVRRGRYLIETMGCAYCHSPVKDDGSVMEGLNLAGGQRLSLYPFTEVVSYNLTSDRDSGLGAWTDDQIKNVLTRGVRPDGSRMLPFPMPWPSYGSLKPQDLDALVAALRALPPISNAIPRPNDLRLVPYLWGKFQVLILGRDIPGVSYPGNAGTPGSGTSWQTAAR